MNAPIPALQRRDSFMGCVDAQIRINDHGFDIALDVFGHITPASVGTSGEAAEPRRLIISRVMFESHDISVALPDKALDAISTVILQETPQ
jgi:hypothetical protein